MYDVSILTKLNWRFPTETIHQIRNIKKQFLTSSILNSIGL